jgi:hypothetical protein
MQTKKSSVGFEVHTAVLAVCFMLASCLASSLAQKMEVCFFKTLVDFQLTTQHYIPEDITLLKKALLDFYLTILTAELYSFKVGGT